MENLPIEKIISMVISLLTLIALVFAFKDRIFHSGGREKSIEDRVSNLEKNDTATMDSIDDLKKDVKTIKENHLAHIQHDINKININLAEINTTLKIKLKE